MQSAGIKRLLDPQFLLFQPADDNRIGDRPTRFILKAAIEPGMFGDKSGMMRVFHHDIPMVKTGGN